MQKNLGGRYGADNNHLLREKGYMEVKGGGTSLLPESDGRFGRKRAGEICHHICLLDFSASVFPINYMKTAAVIPFNHYGTCVIHTPYCSFRSNWRCLHIIHPLKNHTASFRILIPYLLHFFSAWKSHATHNNIRPPSIDAVRLFFQRCRKEPVQEPSV